MKKPLIVLASRSPRRKALLEKNIPRLRCVGAPEPKPATRVPISSLTLQHAQAKGRAVARRYPHAIVIGADTLLKYKGTILGKPAHRAQAKKMLTRVSGRQVQAVTSICVFSHPKKACWTERATVWFKPIPTRALDLYLASKRWKGKAGGFNIEEMPVRGWVKKINGDRNVVIGLPLARLKQILRGLR